MLGVIRHVVDTLLNIAKLYEITTFPTLPNSPLDDLSLL